LVGQNVCGDRIFGVGMGTDILYQSTRTHGPTAMQLQHGQHSLDDFVATDAMLAAFSQFTRPITGYEIFINLPREWKHNIMHYTEKENLS